mmetsp:Transcript_75789/g.234589  ORF Transcript_75789/g.234589 Transcript_75789/m.234589 type:complete len:275 (-) Transcript_75789:8-832(-)
MVKRLLQPVCGLGAALLHLLVHLARVRDVEGVCEALASLLQRISVSGRNGLRRRLQARVGGLQGAGLESLGSCLESLGQQALRDGILQGAGAGLLGAGSVGSACRFLRWCAMVSFHGGRRRCRSPCDGLRRPADRVCSGRQHVLRHGQLGALHRRCDVARAAVLVRPRSTLFGNIEGAHRLHYMLLGTFPNCLGSACNKLLRLTSVNHFGRELLRSFVRDRVCDLLRIEACQPIKLRRGPHGPQQEGDHRQHHSPAFSHSSAGGGRGWAAAWGV